jgi:hypothetical protein
MVEDSIALIRRVGDTSDLVFALVTLGLVATTGMLADVPLPPLLNELNTLLPIVTDRQTIAHIHLVAGLAAGAMGDLVEAEVQHEEALVLYREVSDILGISICLIDLGLLALIRREYVRAAGLLRENLAVAHRTRDLFNIQFALVGLGGVACGEGHLLRAARLWGAAEAAREAAGMQMTRLGSC